MASHLPLDQQSTCILPRENEFSDYLQLQPALPTQPKAPVIDIYFPPSLNPSNLPRNTDTLASAHFTLCIIIAKAHYQPASQPSSQRFTACLRKICPSTFRANIEIYHYYHRFVTCLSSSVVFVVVVLILARLVINYHSSVIVKRKSLGDHNVIKPQNMWSNYR